MQSVVGEIYDGRVIRLTLFGAFVKMSNGETGMVHISEVASVYVKDINEHLKEGQEVRVKVLAVGEDNKIKLSIKQTLPSKQNLSEAQRRRSRQASSFSSGSAKLYARHDDRSSEQQPASMSFEDMIAKFKQESDEKMSVLKKSGDFKGSSRRSNGGGNR